jgi:penicillin amidase
MILRVLGGLLLVLVIGGGGVFLYLRSSLPQVTGHIAVRGLKAPATISRDKDGIPTIDAADDEDAAFALGFVHAQDRLFQMELMRRYAAGRLSEIFGESTVATDKQMRVLGLYRAAEAEFAGLSSPVQRALEAYAAGVNAFLATRGGPFAALPPEFLLLRFKPEPWRPADTLAWGKVMDLDLAGNYRGELLRAAVIRQAPTVDLNFLFPQYPAAAPTTLAGLRDIYRQLPIDRIYASLPDSVGPIFASNNWVVDGAHSESGKPILANDPHLRFGAPGVWYLARIHTSQHDIAGATGPGAPLIVIGHNAHIAWGFTNTGSDVEDLFIEKIDPADPGRYLTPEGSAPFTTRDETITVRGHAPVTLTVRSTRHGPVISDMFPSATTEPGYALALATTFLNGDDRTPQALWNVNRARDWNEFRTALQDFIAPEQNIVFADTSGTIGFIAPALVPIRRNGNGWLPMPGWTGEYDWTGYIPFDQLPQGTAPASGHFVSANNKIVSDRYPYFLSRDWASPNRAERIEAMLRATSRQSPKASAAMQADTLSIAAQRLVPLMTRVVPQSDSAQEAVERLRGWDFRMDADKVEPLLFIAWLRTFAHAVLFNHLGEAAGTELWDLRPEMMENVLNGHPEWCGKPDKNTASCGPLLGASLEAALADLRNRFGDDMTQWQWGRAHIAQFPNPVFDRVPVLGKWLHVSIPTPGGFDTVNRGSPDIRDEAHPYYQRFGAGLRIITDMASPVDARMITVPGQSGNPLSHHFADLVQRWRDFDWLVPGRAPPADTLTLEPAR